jgi:hypothetical protein
LTSLNHGFLNNVLFPKNIILIKTLWYSPQYDVSQGLITSTHAASALERRHAARSVAAALHQVATIQQQQQQQQHEQQQVSNISPELPATGESAYSLHSFSGAKPHSSSMAGFKILPWRADAICSMIRLTTGLSHSIVDSHHVCKLCSSVCD